jgi:DNA-binding PadR family transcriptional regulator
VTAASAETLPTLGYALLALLARQPGTGYDLARQLKDPIGLFWEAGHSQIYPQLGRLEELRLVRSRSARGRGPRPTKTYAITLRGVAALRAWVGQPVRRRGGRDELLLKVYASWVAEPAATLQLLREAEAHHAAQLATYLARRAAAQAAGAADAPPSDPRFTDYATLRRGIGHERGRLAWCRWLARRVARAAPGSA